MPNILLARPILPRPNYLSAARLKLRHRRRDSLYSEHPRCPLEERAAHFMGGVTIALGLGPSENASPPKA
jgi:hypothetical protein